MRSFISRWRGMFARLTLSRRGLVLLLIGLVAVVLPNLFAFIAAGHEAGTVVPLLRRRQLAALSRIYVSDAASFGRYPAVCLVAACTFVILLPLLAVAAGYDSAKPDLADEVDGRRQDGGKSSAIAVLAHALALGAVLVCLAVITTTLVLLLAAVLGQMPLSGSSLVAVAHFVVAMVPLTFAYGGLVVALSTALRRTDLSLVVAAGVCFVLWMARPLASEGAWIPWLFPTSNESALLFGGVGTASAWLHLAVFFAGTMLTATIARDRWQRSLRLAARPAASLPNAELKLRKS